MEIVELKEILQVQDIESKKKWCRSNLSTIIETYKLSRLSQSDFSKTIGLEAKYFYGLISVARRQEMLPRSKLGLSRMQKKRVKKSISIKKEDFKAVSIREPIRPKTFPIIIKLNDMAIEVASTKDAAEIIKAIRC
tara:strand:+ start:5025 stop:5432 length:408 start_codon:yes stop_codon:yes gene_type:complete